MIQPLDALAAETQRTAAFLDQLSGDDWERPTRCPPMDVTELTFHAFRGAGRLLEVAQRPVPGEAQIDAVQYFRYDPVAEGRGIVERAQSGAAGLTPADLCAAWKTQWPQAIATAQEAGAASGVMIESPFGGGRLLLSEYAKTRVLEVTIHTMDLRDAVGLSPDPTEAGLTVTCDVLRGLLGADLRPLGIDDVRFALTGTGREPLDGAETELLGPLAKLFPLLA